MQIISERSKVVEFCLLASRSEPFDPMERALREMGIPALSATEHLHDDWVLMQEYPLSEELLAMSRVWRSGDGRRYVIGAKGAPEAIANLCHLDDREAAKLASAIDAMSADGLRVIGACHDRSLGPYRRRQAEAYHQRRRRRLHHGL